MADFYEILEVPRDAPAEEIKKAYRRLARECTSRRQPRRRARRRRASRSSPPPTRCCPILTSGPRYDRFGSADGFDIGDPFGSGEGFGDLFDAFFGGGQPVPVRRACRADPAGPARGSRPRGGGHPGFTEALLRRHDRRDGPHRRRLRELRGHRRRARHVCQRPVPSSAAAPGEVRSVRNTVLGQIVSASRLSAVRRNRSGDPEPCPECQGEGRIVTDRTFTVDVPPGVDDGSTLRLTGRGAVGPRGGGAGDLYVRLRVRPDERFDRQGDDLVHRLEAADDPGSARRGCRGRDASTARRSCTIPPGTQSGRLFKLRGRGVPHLNGRGRGDLIVVADVAVPSRSRRGVRAPVAGAGRAPR